ncbi:MAG TPA: glutathione transferase GstA [Kofleriaceae bacterium]|jgi:glutathione S-transferase|nr:glutathione transferase GstA [Kofleriaceae bacterium]
MKLYYSPGACSLSPHIVAREAGLPIQLVLVGRDKQLPDGRDFRTINPNGYVPALELDDGTVLTEGPAIVQYLADQVPELGLAPPNGSIQRYQLQSWLNFITTELHKTFSPLFNPKTPDAFKTMTREKLTDRFSFVNEQLGKDGRRYLTGETFTVADAYLFVILRWAGAMGFELTRWPAITRFIADVAARPAVDSALDAEKLKKAA